MDQDRLGIQRYKVSGDDTLLDKVNHITPEVRRILEEIRPDVEKGRKYLVKKLNKLCLKYPRVPVFKNILSTLYQQQGNSKQAFAVNQWLVKEHPGYLFGKLNLAAEFLLKNEPEKIPEILGGAMEIGQLYPERNEFHLEEVIGFNTIAVQYFLAVDDIEAAEMRVEMLEDLDEDHPKVLLAKQSLQEWYFTMAAERLESEEQLGQTVILKDNRSHLQTTQAPHFNFPEHIGWLYENDLGISHEKIVQILQLDPSKLIEDLHSVLQDSIARFDFFAAVAENEGYNNKKLFFPIHALLLLAALKSERSLIPILEILKQDKEYNGLWLGDYMGDIIENAIYHCGRNQTEELFGFLKLSNIYSGSMAVVGEALVKIIAASDEKREVFEEEYRQVLNVLIENADDENYADTDTTGFIISDITDLAYHELLPEITQLFELDIVGFWICGSFEDVESEIRKQPVEPYLDFINLDIYQKYDELSSDDSGAPSDLQDEELFTDLYNREMLKQTFKENDEQLFNTIKAGRNDPCPCGSGKKYKKCCL